METKSENIKMFSTILISNRGEIAVRIAKTLKKMNIKSVAIYSEVDRNSEHVSACDIAICLDGLTPQEAYLRGDRIIEIAKETNAEAIIPGYGFLSENADFVDDCNNAGIVFCGPNTSQIRQFGLKHSAREVAKSLNIPILSGSDLINDLDDAIKCAEEIGYPLMIKSTAGGGGIGMKCLQNLNELKDSFDSLKRLSLNHFGNDGLYIEKFVENARHIEVQLFGDGNGNVKILGIRDCSIQRRHQKIIEETPAPNLPPEIESRLRESSKRLAKFVCYRSVGTIEYIYDIEQKEFFFIEANTRLQVEHGITEMCTNIDLVEWMILNAANIPISYDFEISPNTFSIEARIYSEDPLHDYQPSYGVLNNVSFPTSKEDLRIDTWVNTGTLISVYYDSMIAKVIVKGTSRLEALEKMKYALDEIKIAGVKTNLNHLRQIVSSNFYINGDYSLSSLSLMKIEIPIIEVIEPGTYSTIQDYPGRIGYWSIGVPPSGPMDEFAFRLGNRIVGNDTKCASLEITMVGPILKFHTDEIIALTGAPSFATIDGKKVDFWCPVEVKRGQILNIGKISEGCRNYLSVRNGFDVPDYLGSKSTFVLGQFGGHCGSILKSGDMLLLNDLRKLHCIKGSIFVSPIELIPTYSSTTWEIDVLYGPHGSPEFFTDEFIEEFFKTAWEVHYNSNRLGIRLVGPKPGWTRASGGEAGLHPSNIHDTIYAIGTVNFTGDMPVILTNDGPSMGGFVCPVTIIKSHLWKVGQVKPGDKIYFRLVDFDCALKQEEIYEKKFEASNCIEYETFNRKEIKLSEAICILAKLSENGERPSVIYRQAGDKCILIEYGENCLDLTLRFRIEALIQKLKSEPINGIIQISPGVRSLQIHYESRVIHQKDIVEKLLKLENTLYDIESIPSRIVYLPMAFEDSSTIDSIKRYRNSVRDKAPWLPSNIEFIRRMNGLNSTDDVRKIIFDASYMVLGLGDVYLGAPCAVPIDPRHRLVTSKYNPARLYTAEGDVGIGGVYMCIYGMESPGGYQLVGRTVPIWNTFLKNSQFINNEPWLLKCFDRIQFFEVSEKELLFERQEFKEGRFKLRILEDKFNINEYKKFLADNNNSINEFKQNQDMAFKEEIEKWKIDDVAPMEKEVHCHMFKNVTDIKGNVIKSAFCGIISKVLVEKGESVSVGQCLLIIEAMKMEFNLNSEYDGIVHLIMCKTGDIVSIGDLLFVINN